MKPAVALLLTLPLIAHAFQNEPEGFRGLPWGTTYDSVRGQFHPPSTRAANPERVTLRRIGDKLQIGGAQLTDITYTFHAGRLVYVYIRAAEEAKNKPELLDAYEAQFGPGARQKPGYDRWMWMGGTTMMVLSCEPPRSACTSQIHSRAFMDAEIEARKTRAQEAKKDF